MTKEDKKYLESCLERAEHSFISDIMPFWMNHGLDTVHGGVYTCLDRDGTLMDPTKSVWFQGRFGYIAALAALGDPSRKDWLDASRSCIDFIKAHCFDTDGHMYFEVGADGTPLRKRRYVFSECFSAGAKELRERSGGKEKVYRLKDEELEKRYYNGILNANISRYMHTKNTEYIRAMKMCSFIVPVRVINHPYATIKYPVVYSTGNLSYAFIAFSDLTEYGKWKEKQKEAEWVSGKNDDYEWDPMLIDCISLVRIGKEHGVVLDLFGAGLYLDKKMIAEYLDNTGSNAQ